MGSGRGLSDTKLYGTLIAIYLSVPPIRTLQTGKTRRRILMKVKFSFLFLLAVCSIVALPSISAANPVLRLSTGGTTIEITDGGIGDSNPETGAITYIGGIGNWFSNVVTGQSNLGTDSVPIFDLNSVDKSSSVPGDLVIMFSDEGFLGDGQMRIFDASIGGTTYGTLSYSTYYGVGLFDTTNKVADLVFPYTPFSGSGSVSGIPGESFSMTQVVTISHPSGNNKVSSFNGMLSDPNPNPVPEPSSLILLGSGLLGTCFFFRRRTV